MENLVSKFRKESAFKLVSSKSKMSGQERVHVTICTNSNSSNVEGLIQYITHNMNDVVETVNFQQLPYNISDMDKYDVSKIDVLLLCHSIDNRRFSLTDVGGALYDGFLPRALEKLGKSKVGVIAHDFQEDYLTSEGHSSRMGSFRQSQSTTFKCASLVMIGGQLSSEPISLTDNQLNDLRQFFSEAIHVSQSSVEPTIEPVQNPSVCLKLKRHVLRKWLFQGLFRPHDVMFYNGKYIITDTGHRLIRSYDPETGSLTTVCRIWLSWLYGLAPLSDHNNGYLVVDNWRGRVYRIHENRYDIWTSTNMCSPTGITVYKKEVFVANFGSHKITVYKESDGTYLRSFGSDHLRRPWFLAVNSTGHLYVTDLKAINIFTVEGNHVQEFKLDINSMTWAYRGIAIDRHDNVYVTARDGTAGRSGTETVAVLDSNHKLLQHHTNSIDFMHFLRGLCINHDTNEVVVVDGEWHRLKMFQMYTT